MNLHQTNRVVDGCSAAPTTLFRHPSRVPQWPKAKPQPHERRSYPGGKQSKMYPLSQTLTLSQRFIVQDPVHCFVHNWKATWVTWVSLVQSMALPSSVSVAELDIESKVETLQHVISGKDKSLSPRFGHVQMVLFLGALERRVRQDRINGLIVVERSDKTQAIDMFIICLDRILNCRTPRSRVWALKRFGEKWSEVVGSLVLLLPILTRTAEIYV